MMRHHGPAILLVVTQLFLQSTSCALQGGAAPTQHGVPVFLSATKACDSDLSDGHSSTDSPLMVDESDSNPGKLLLDRRQACLVPFLGSVVASSTPAFAEAAAPDFRVVSNLPPLNESQARIFLCRHGQTENNRLKLIQGARIDPPINNNGIAQAERLGKALMFAVPIPGIMFHSTLSRAQQTASLASQQMGLPNQRPPPLAVIPELAEIDFGTVEGFEVEAVRSKMVSTYARWAMGDIEVRMAEDGENFYEILDRIQTALSKLTRAANGCSSRCVAAVAHSTYIRILLAVVQELPLVQVSTIEQKNACINVIDFNIDGSMKTIKSSSNLFGGLLSQAPANLSVQVPAATVVRTGEKRHLGELAL